MWTGRGARSVTCATPPSTPSWRRGQVSWGCLGAGTAGRKASGNQSGHSLCSWTGTVHPRLRLFLASVSFGAEGCRGSEMGNIQPKLPLCWILMSGLWKPCLINLQRPPVRWPCTDKAVICPGGLREHEPRGNWGRISLQLLHSPLCTWDQAGNSLQDWSRAGNLEHRMEHKGTEIKEPGEEHRASYSKGKAILQYWVLWK